MGHLRFIALIAVTTLSSVLAASVGFETDSPSFASRPQTWKPVAENLNNHNASSPSGVTFYWGNHQVGETVLAFSKDVFSTQTPQVVSRKLNYPAQGSNGGQITYLEVFVRNGASENQVYVYEGGIGAYFIGVHIGSKVPTTFFEYKATLYGFE